LKPTVGTLQEGGASFATTHWSVVARSALTDVPDATDALARLCEVYWPPIYSFIRRIDESVYTGSADTGSNFRISSCQYIYNLSASALGVGTYSVDILIDDQVVGSAAFGLR
jgi:hypothetical protein